MKISVSSYSFSQLIQKGEMTQFDCIAKAKELGFDGIEFVEINPHDGSSPLAYAQKLKDECARLKLPITCYTFGADFINGSNHDTKAEIDRAKESIDIATVLGVNIVRHDATVGNEKYRTFDDTLVILADACREVTLYAETKGIRTTFENHGFFCQDSDRVEKLLTAVAHKNFGLLTDMGNFLCADEDPAKAFSRVARYAFYAHAKDFHIKSAMLPNPGEGFFRTRGGNFLRGAIIGHGDVPIKQCLQALKQVGYNGYIAIEFEGLEHAILALKIGLENLRNYIL